MSFTREDVLRMDVSDLSVLLDRKSIQHNDVTDINEMQELYMNCMNETCVDSVEDGANLAEMENVIEKDQKKRAELVEIYDMLIAFFEVQNEDLDQIKLIMEITCTNFQGPLAANKDKLCSNECPIVIAGETSAGKSTLLNLLLGTEILPHSLLGTTALVCHLHNSSEKRFEIHLDNNDIVTVIADSDEEMKERLKPYVTAREEHTQPKYTKVDVYWPIPMLHEHVTIVDTPGIGENDQLTNRLLTYLPNAVAFIYVINAPNSGGIQDDYLLRILQHLVAEWSSSNLLQNVIDYESTLFVCNKWDKVKIANEEDRVWYHITKRLTNLLPNFPKEHILKMSATLAQRNKKNGLGPTPEHTTFLRGIEKLTAQSIPAKTRKYCIWIRRFLEKIQSILLSRINHAERNKQDKEKLKIDVLARLDKLYKDTVEIKSELLESAEHECVDIVNNLSKYIQDENVKESILSWDDHDIPDILFNDFNMAKYEAENYIQSRIKRVLVKWGRQNHIMENSTDRLMSKLISKYNLLTTESESIAAVIEGSDERDVEDEEHIQDEFYFEATFHEENFITSREHEESAALMNLLLPVTISMNDIDVIQKASFINNKVKYMKQWTQEVMNSSSTKAGIEAYVIQFYFGAFEKKIEKIFTCSIPNQIKAYVKLIEDICDDERTSKDIVMVFKPLHEQVRSIQAKLQMYELVDIKHNNISALELMVEGSFYNVYKAKWSKTGIMDVAVKVISQKLDGNRFWGRFEEVSLMKKIQHANVVKVHDICCWTYDDDVKKLAVVQELCEGNLEDIVFRNEKLQCCKFSDADRDEAFSFYLNMAIGVCEGLAEIHQHGYLHGDLKLSNVLVKKETAKLCGHYFTKSKAPPTERFAETRQPEQRASDKFKLGILLWELWYGRHAYSVVGRTSATMVDSPDISGTDVCLKFTDKYSPSDELQALIRQCCIQDSPQLATAYYVSCKLVRLVKE